MTWRFVAAIAGVGLLACATSTRPAMMVTASILPEISSRESTWVASRTPIVFSGGEASDCAGYDRLKGSGIVEEVSNELVKSEYLICDVLERLGKNAAVKPLSDGAAYGESLASRLDLRSFPSSLGPRLDEGRYTLSHTFEPGQLKIGPAKVAVITHDWSLVFEVVLVGDLDGSGADDWLVWLTDEALDGNYRSYQTLLINDVRSDGPLQARSL